MRDLKNSTFIDFDLPKNMALTAYYLLSSFPEKKILLYWEKDFENVNYDEYDAILLPNFELKKVKSSSVNVSFNSWTEILISIESFPKFYI